jgi:hypothetical protein
VWGGVWGVWGGGVGCGGCVCVEECVWTAAGAGGACVTWGFKTNKLKTALYL